MLLRSKPFSFGDCVSAFIGVAIKAMSSPASKENLRLPATVVSTIDWGFSRWKKPEALAMKEACFFTVTIGKVPAVVAGCGATL